MKRLQRRVGRVAGLSGPGPVMVSLASAVGLVVGVRSVVALELPGVRTLLRLPAMPREPMGIAWTTRVVWPDQLQDAALERIAALVAALVLAAACVSLLDVLVLLLEAGASRRREIAIRAAVGAGPRRLVALLMRDVRRLLSAGLALGLLLGLAGGGAVRAAWPGELREVGLASATGTLVPVLAVLLAVSAAAYVGVGLRVGRRGALAAELGAGGRATADRAEAFERRALSAVQMGAAGAVTIATLSLALAVERPVGGTEQRDDVVAVSVTAPGEASEAGWAAVLERLGDIPGLSAESLATPGALVGLGVRDHATAQCGACMRGGLPLPFWGARADHHAVAPGFFAAVGIPVLAGRDLTPGDHARGRRVALVNRTFAAGSFEDGDPLGRLVRLGRDIDAWYEVVGVVEDRPAAAVGGDDLARPAVWVNALQHPLRQVDVLLRGPADAVRTAVAVLEGAGYAPAPPRTLAEERRRAFAPLRWSIGIAVAMGLLTLALAVHGGHATALQVTRRRTRELALRRVLGATDRRVLWHVLAGSARAALWGAAFAVFFGALLVGLLRRAAGGVPAPGPEAYLAVTVLLVGTALLASMRAAREALAVEPGAALE